MNLPVDLSESSSTSDTSSYTSEVQYATPSMSLTAIVPTSVAYNALSKHLIPTASSSLHLDAHLSGWQREQRDKQVAQDI